jgi:hypothetical protein
MNGPTIPHEQQQRSTTKNKPITTTPIFLRVLLTVPSFSNTAGFSFVYATPPSLLKGDSGLMKHFSDSLTPLRRDSLYFSASELWERRRQSAEHVEKVTQISLGRGCQNSAKDEYGKNEITLQQISVRRVVPHTAFQNRKGRIHLAQQSCQRPLHRRLH